jgi:hypothetical protein
VFNAREMPRLKERAGIDSLRECIGIGREM